MLPELLLGTSVRRSSRANLMPLRSRNHTVRSLLGFVLCDFFFCYGGRMNAVDLEPLERPAWLWPRAAYIHVPFCAHHCGYCDFAVVAGRDHLSGIYLEALKQEIAGQGRPQSVHTLF